MHYDNTAYKDYKRTESSEVGDRIDQWHLERKGKFTASRAWKLLVKGVGDEMFGRGAKTYIEDKAVEMVTRFWERPGVDDADPILHGYAHEFEAYKEYVHVTKNTSLRYLGTEKPVFFTHHKFPEEFGGTPDGVLIENSSSISLGLEIKCPKDPKVHFQRLKWVDQWDVKDNYGLCYAQCQALMMCTDAPEWHFISFDERQIYRKYRSKIITIKPDKNFQNGLEVRIRQASKEKYRIISEHLGISVSNYEEFTREFSAA